MTRVICRTLLAPPLDFTPASPPAMQSAPQMHALPASRAHLLPGSRSGTVTLKMLSYRLSPTQSFRSSACFTTPGLSTQGSRGVLCLVWSYWAGHRGAFQAPSPTKKCISAHGVTHMLANIRQHACAGTPMWPCDLLIYSRLSLPSERPVRASGRVRLQCHPRHSPSHTLGSCKSGTPPTK